MRARAQKNRWEEELARTEKEMVWTTLYFMHQRDKWYLRSQILQRNEESSSGHQAFCEQMIFQWEEFSRTADIRFGQVNSQFQTTWIPLVTFP